MKKTIVVLLIIPLLLSSLTMAVGCQQEPEPTPAPAPAPATTLAPTPAPAPKPTPAPPPPAPALPAPDESSLDVVNIPTIEVPAGEIQQLEVIATDQNGNLVSEYDVAWTIADENAGSITENGMFTAGEVAGTFSKAVEVRVTQGDLIRTAVAPITITPGPLEQVVIAPNPAEIGMEVTQQFVAVGADQYGNRISGLTFSWSVENGGGTINGTGLFTAGATSGTYEDTVEVKATQGSVTRSATANVTVEPDRITFFFGQVSEGGMVVPKKIESYIMDADGSNMKQLTTASEDDGGWRLVLTEEETASADFSPTTSKFVFVKEIVDNSDIYVIDVDGGNLTQLTDTSDESESNPKWSPDGARIMFSKDSDIYVIDVDGGNLFQLTDTSDESVRYPRWSPDGARIMFSKDSDIYVIDVDGGNLFQLADTSGYSEPVPVWSPDCTQIAFTFRECIYVINADGSDRKRLISYVGHSVIPRWSPDGTKIAFTADGDINVMNADGANLRQLTDTGSKKDAVSPAWSPDGSKIIFVSVQYTWTIVGSEGWPVKPITRKDIERSEIYVMDANGSHKTSLTDSEDYLMNLHWVPRKRGVEVTEDSVIIPGAGNR